MKWLTRFIFSLSLISTSVMAQNQDAPIVQNLADSVYVFNF